MNPALPPGTRHECARPPVPDGTDGVVFIRNPAGSTAGDRTCLYRQAAPDELGRAAALCPPAPVRPGEGLRRCFVAVRPQPVERLIAAAFWKLVAETDGTLAAEIQWATLPALGEQVRAFLEALVASVTVLEPGAATIASAEWLAADHPAAAALRAVGFAAAGTRTYYQADAAVCRNALGTPPQAAVNTLLITPPQVGHFDCLRTLLCGASLRPSELAHGCNTASSEAPSLFDPRCSGVVLADGMVVAACLANASRGHISLAALAGPPDACAHLLHHCLQGRDHLPQPVTLGIHLDERDRPAALAALLEQLPFQNAGQLVRYERPVSARKTQKSKCAKSFATEINVALHGRTGGTRCLPSQAGSLQRA